MTSRSSKGTDPPAGQGEAARLVRSHDWARTPLGPIETWSPVLRSTVELVLAHGFPAVLLWGPDLIQIYNDGYRVIMGDKHPAGLGQPTRDCWPEVWHINQPIYDRVWAGETLTFEDKLFPITRHGALEDAWFTLTYSPVRENEAIAGVLVTVVETTQAHADAAHRDRAEAAMRESEGRLRALVEATSDVIYRMSPDWTEMRQLAGHGFLADTEGPTIRWIDDYIFPEDRPHVLAAIAAAVRAKRPFELEHRVRRADGSPGWTFSRAIPMLDADGGIVEWFGTATDITVRKRAEAMLRETEERQAFLLELSDALRPLTDPVAVQETASHMLGEHLGVDWAYYVDIDEARQVATIEREHRRGDVPSLVGAYGFAGFSAVIDPLRTGRPVVFSDVEADPAVSPVDLAAYRAVSHRAILDTPLIKNGALVCAMCATSAEPRRWTEGDVVLVEAVAERTWAAVERARAEAALRESEDRYRTLFETMGQGYCELELVRDADGRAVDQHYLEFNPAYERLIGIPVAEARGRLASAVMPDLEPWWTEAFDRIARRGEAERIEHRVESLDRWFEAYVYPRGGDRLTVLYEDISGRKRAEIALRESEERRAFLLELSDALRSLADPVEVQRTAMDLVAEHFGVESAVYFDVGADGDHAAITEGRRSTRIAFPPTIRFSDFASFAAGDFRDGRTILYEDIETDPRFEETRTSFRALSIRSGAGFPLVKEGRLLAVLAINDVEPRKWPASELRLLEDIADRIWSAVERARADAALRESEERLRQFGEASQDVLWIRDAETLQWVYLTPAFETIYGLSRDEALSGENYRNWLDLVIPEDRESANASMQRIRAGEHVTFDYRIRRPSDGAIRWMRNTDFPIRDAAGRVALIGGIGHDATALRQSELRLQTLVEGVPQLVWRAVDTGHWTWSSPQWTDYTGLEPEESLGLGWLDALHPDDRAEAMRFWKDAERSGQLEMEARICTAETGEYRWFQTRATPVRDAGGAIVEWLGTSTDVHDLRALQEQQKVLVAELQHRTRNLMGVVRSMADKTARASADLSDFRARFRDRLEALARVQGLLSRLESHDRVTFDALIRSELSAMDGNAEKVTLAGPAGVRLRSSTVQTLAMALHELATNAVKYGALRQRGGRLAVTWSLEAPDARGRPWLQIDWRESGVALPPAAASPRGSGQGRELIEKALPYQLGARTAYTIAADGVHCVIAIPVSSSTMEIDDHD